MAKANTKHSRNSKNTDPLEQAFEALKELPPTSSYRPEGCFTRKEMAEKFNGSRTKGDAAIKRLLEAGKIKKHDHVGAGNRSYFYYVG